MAKVMISLPEEFLKKVDRIAKAQNRSRSELIREGLRALLNPQVGLRRSWKHALTPLRNSNSFGSASGIQRTLSATTEMPAMAAKIVVDTSVLIKWIKARDEDLVDRARHLLTVVESRPLDVHVPGLLLYELG